MSFARAVTFVLRFEGGLVDDPNDPGGLTNFGIALNRHPELSAEQIRALTSQSAAQIYHGVAYWGAIKGDLLPDGLQLPMLDTAVVEGPASAIRFLQHALYLPEDGILGPETLRAAGLASLASVVRGFSAERIVSLSGKSGWAHDGRGWTTRAIAAAMEALSS